MSKKHYEGFSERLTAARQSQDLTKCALARKCGLTYHAIWKMERGDTIPHEYNLMAIADVLNVSIDYLKYGGSARCANHTEK